MSQVSSFPESDPGHSPRSPDENVNPWASYETAKLAKQKLSELPSLGERSTSSIPNATHISAEVEETKEQAIKNRDGHLWTCTDRIQEPEGFVYRFKLRKKFDTSEYTYFANVSEQAKQKWMAANEILETIFPATEKRVEALTDSNVWNWEMYHRGTRNADPTYRILKNKLKSGEINSIPVPIRNRNVNEVLVKLGYKLEITKDGIYLNLPDEKVLVERWNKMVDAQPEKRLRKLIVLASKGVANDNEFSQAFILRKILLSTGSEYVHDHQIHIIPILCYMLEESDSYDEAREMYSTLVAGLVEKVNRARGLIAQKISEIGPDIPQEEKEYYRRLEKNLVLADTIPSIAADNFAATPALPMKEIHQYHRFSYFRRSIKNFSNFVENRYLSEVCEKYKIEHNGAEMPAEERNKLENDISFMWMFDQIDKFLDEKKAK